MYQIFLQYTTTFPFSCPKALDKTSSSPPFTAMKDLPRPSSYGSVYVPPHHRLRSVITSSASSPDISSTSHAVVANNSFVNSSLSSNTNTLGNSYPYLPPNQQQQQQSQIDDVSKEVSYRELEPSIHTVSFVILHLLQCN